MGHVLPHTGVLLATVAFVMPVAVLSQTPKPVLGADGEPRWSRTLTLSDGRTFISDGALALDAAVVKEAPQEKLTGASSRAIEKFLAAPPKDEYAYSQLSKGRFPRSYAAPSGVTLNADYVDYLARTLGKGKLRLRMNGLRDPIVIVAGGKAVGVVMPLAQ